MRISKLATTIKLKHSGYLYIWVSNETQNWQAFFDNLSVQDYSGPMREEAHYYPFGLTMAGISDKALKSQYAQNKYRYNNKELENQEFGDGSGLEEYGFGARMQDPQLGIWHNIDPKADYNSGVSPYNYVQNNPIRMVDPDGMAIVDGVSVDALTGLVTGNLVVNSGMIRVRNPGYGDEVWDYRNECSDGDGDNEASFYATWDQAGAKNAYGGERTEDQIEGTYNTAFE